MLSMGVGGSPVGSKAKIFDVVESVGFQSDVDAHGQRLIWVELAVVERLTAMCEPGESYSDVSSAT